MDWGVAKCWALSKFFPTKSPSSNVTSMFVLVWVYFIILNIICVYRALQTVTDNRLPAWEVASSAVQTQHSILQYSTARGTRPRFLAFSTCFPLSCEPFLGYFSAPVIVGLRGDKHLAADACPTYPYLPAWVHWELCPKSAGHKGSLCWAQRISAVSRQLPGSFSQWKERSLQRQFQVTSSSKG